MVPTAIQAHINISGEFGASGSLGIYTPQTQLNLLVASIPFNAHFLTYSKEEEEPIGCQTTVLEALGPLVTLAIDPWRFMNTQTVFKIDNMATCIAYTKGRAKTAYLASSLVRAARVVAASINTKLVVQWERRRSTKASRIADDLTHNLLKECTPQEVQSFLEKNVLTFPPPIQSWITNPAPSSTLGPDLLAWMSQVHGTPHLSTPVVHPGYTNSGEVPVLSCPCTC